MAKIVINLNDDIQTKRAKVIALAQAAAYSAIAQWREDDADLIDVSHIELRVYCDQAVKNVRAEIDRATATVQEEYRLMAIFALEFHRTVGEELGL
jgi:hypothetical protein